MVKATWNGAVIAESDDTVVVEGNHYFPQDALNPGVILASTTTSVCSWKGTAHYISILVDGDKNEDAGWFYPDPKPAAAEIKDRIAFWRGVKVA